MGWWSRRKARRAARKSTPSSSAYGSSGTSGGFQQLPQIIVLFLLHFLELGGINKFSFFRRRRFRWGKFFRRRIFRRERFKFFNIRKYKLSCRLPRSRTTN